MRKQQKRKVMEVTETLSSKESDRLGSNLDDNQRHEVATEITQPNIRQGQNEAGKANVSFSGLRRKLP